RTVSLVCLRSGVYPAVRELPRLRAGEAVERIPGGVPDPARKTGLRLRNRHAGNAQLSARGRTPLPESPLGGRALASWDRRVVLWEIRGSFLKSKGEDLWRYWEITPSKSSCRKGLLEPSISPNTAF